MSSSRQGTSSSSSQSKMRIRAFPTNMDEKFVAQTWASLERAIQEIQRKNNSGLSFEELYRNAYTMVLHKHGEKLYNGLKKVVDDHLKGAIVPIVSEAMSHDQLLEVLNLIWQDHTTAMIMIRDILMYMDRVYVAQQNVENVYSLGLLIFRDTILQQHGVNEELRKTLLSMIADEREGTHVQWMGIKQACQMLVALGLDSRDVYIREFEQPFLSETSEFYVLKGQKFLEAKNASGYIKEVEQCLENETTRAKRYLDAETETKVLEVLDRVLISNHMNTVVNMENSGVEHMLANDMIDDLKRMYRLLRRVTEGLNTMTIALSRYLRTLGDTIVNETGDLANNPVKYVQSLLDLKDRCDHFLLDAFANDKVFKNKIQYDFESFFNKNPKSPEYLSLYMDDKLKKGNRVVGDAEIESHLDKAMVLFRFLQEKDIFEKFYKQHLAKRLLLDKSISDDAEKAMLSKLKTECGCQFTQKLESMFRDKELWGTVANGYKDYKDANNLVARSRDPVDISVRVLTAGIWPTQTSTIQSILPTVCMTSFKTFEEFYIQKHNGRKITLNTLLGNADIRAIFYGFTECANQQEEPGSSSIVPLARKEKIQEKILQTNTHTMVLLMRFNAKPRMTFEEIMADTQIPEKELKRILQSLSLGKPVQRILTRKGKGKDIEGKDEFYVNDSFTSKQIRIKIQLVTTKSDIEPERKDIKNRVDEDRKHEVEAAIVRIMKSRKQLAHNNLITEVTHQLRHRFMPSPILIKKRIESLIEREYLARDNNDHKLYNYVA